MAQKIAIIGAGLMGMVLARKLADQGHRVTVYEQQAQTGGLSTWHDYGDFVWDRFYHVILPSDSALIELVRDLDLEQQLHWQRTRTGFYVDHKLYSISNNIEFLRFPLLSFWSKLRLGWTMLYGSRINDWKKLETRTSEEWLIRVSGRETFEKMWKPLLLAKLGVHYRRASAVFIWSYIKRMFSARDKSADAEHLGHVRGGYQTIFSALDSAVRKTGGSVRTGTTIDRVHAPGNRLQIESQAGLDDFDKVICTGPVPVLQRIVDPNLLAVTPASGPEDNADTRTVEYLGVVCVVLVTREPLVPYYVVNIADADIPFTGMIGMSNVADTADTAGLHLTYLPKYILSSDEALQLDDEHYQETFLQGVEKMLPDFDRKNLVSVHVNRATTVQPLQVLNYSELIPTLTTQHPDLFVLNTSQFSHSTLNNNEVVSAVNHFVELHSTALASPAAAAPAT
ncbi:MAG: NAD(P)/FAD-dependent oxidoreductase [Gammaproteobacteria bacterium]|nr:NAD(P)/FAD-dependent oxidoreductase [Gammaproteobacteria bacterium]